MDFWFSLCSLFLYSLTGFFFQSNHVVAKIISLVRVINWSFSTVLHFFNILFRLTFPFLHFIFLYGNFPFLAEWKYKLVLHFGIRISSLLKQIWFPGLLFLI